MHHIFAEIVGIEVSQIERLLLFLDEAEKVGLAKHFYINPR